MSLVVVVLTAAVLLGWAGGGSLDRLGALPLRSRGLLAGALAAQLTGTLVGGPVHPLGLLVSAGLVVRFLARNRGIRGTGLLALGLVANALVVGLNGAMPVSPTAAARAGVAAQDLPGDQRHELTGPGTRLRALGDVLPVPLPVRPEVVSAGDVLVAAGLAQLVVLAMVGAGGAHRAPAGPGPDRTPQGRPHRPLPPLPVLGSSRSLSPARPPRAPAPRTAAPRPPSGS